MTNDVCKREKQPQGALGLARNVPGTHSVDCQLPRTVGGRGIYLKAAAKFWKGITSVHIALNAQEECESLIPRRTCTMHTPVCRVCLQNHQTQSINCEQGYLHTKMSRKIITKHLRKPSAG